MHSIISVFLYSFKSTFRNFKSSGIMFILPIVFMGIFGLAFGGQSVNNLEIGIYKSPSDQIDVASVFKEVDKNSDSIEVKIKEYTDQNKLSNDIEKEEIEVGIIQNDNLTFNILILDQSPSSFSNQAIVKDVLTGVANQGSGVDTTVIDENASSLSGFDYLAPGLMVYGLIILIPGIAQKFSSITEDNYIFRYANSKIKSSEIIFGNVLFYMFIGIIQTIILYLTAQMFGYDAIGNISLVFVPAILTLLFVIAIGLLVGGIFKKSEGATNTGTIISIILGFFSGSFIAGIGNVFTFDLFGRNFQFNDFIPTKWSTIAFEKILTKDLGLADIQTELLVIGISGILALTISIFVYSKLQLEKHQ